MNRSKKELGFLACGTPVFDRPRTHLHGPIKTYLSEAISQVSAEGRRVIREEIAFPKIIGQRTCVQTNARDRIVYSRRPGRRGFTRFVLDREPEDTDSLAMVLKKDECEEFYVCLTAYLGSLSEPEPWDEFANPESRFFWETHAIVWDSDEVIPGWELDECPW